MRVEELKQRQGAIWGSGAFERIAATISDLHEQVVERLDPRPGERLLDLACGTGGVAELAARRGAFVVGVDLATALLETAKGRAAERGLEIDYRLGDAEKLPLRDAELDAAASTFGIMFASDQQAAARELARVVRPGGRIAIANWRPTSSIVRFFEMLAPFQTAPPPPVSPFEWGRPEIVRELLGESFELTFEEGISTYRVGSGEEYWELFSTSFGPVKTLAESLEPERREAFHRAFVDFYETDFRDGDEVVHPREYLLTLGLRR
jgi:SAM-dependent methyltransferase